MTNFEDRRIEQLTNEELAKVEAKADVTAAAFKAMQLEIDPDELRIEVEKAIALFEKHEGQ